MNTIEPHKGNLLIAELSITGETFFNRSVVLLAEHNKDGSVGFIVNKPTEFTLSDFMPDIASNDEYVIYQGGPVERNHLYFIHRIPELIPNSVEIDSGIYWGGDFNFVSKLIVQNQISADDIRFFLGYSGWDGDQLIYELETQSWILMNNTDHARIICKSTDFWKEKMVELGDEYAIWCNAPENLSDN